MLLLFASPLLAQTCDPEQPFPYSPSPVFSFQYNGEISEYYINFFKIQWRRPADEGWTDAADLYCRYEPRQNPDGSCCHLEWGCPVLRVGFPIQRYLPALPGTPYELRVIGCRYDQWLDQDVCGGTDSTSGPWCMPLVMVCDTHGCSAVGVD